MFPRKGYLEMLKYDSEKMMLSCAGTVGELLSDLAAMTMRALYNMADGDRRGVQCLLSTYVSALVHAGHDNEAWEILASTEKDATTVNPSHLMNGMKRGEEGEQ